MAVALLVKLLKRSARYVLLLVFVSTTALFLTFAVLPRAGLFEVCTLYHVIIGCTCARNTAWFIVAVSNSLYAPYAPGYLLINKLYRIVFMLEARHANAGHFRFARCGFVHCGGMFKEILIVLVACRVVPFQCAL